MGVVQATLMLFLIFFGLMFMGVPISVSIGVASISILLTGFDLNTLAYIVAQRCFSGIDSFGLLALPFFMLAGSIMNKGGIARRLVRLARCFVGKIPGYLAATNVLTNMFFGAISGSSVAAASAVGKIMGPLEKQENYEDAYAAAINICSAPTGVIIPPSGPLILFSLTAGGVSVSALFMAGYIPGILLGLCVMAVAIIIAKKKGYTGSTVKEDASTLKIFLDAIPCILMMVIGRHPAGLVYRYRGWYRGLPVLHCIGLPVPRTDRQAAVEPDERVHDGYCCDPVPDCCIQYHELRNELYRHSCRTERNAYEHYGQ